MKKTWRILGVVTSCYAIVGFVFIASFVSSGRILEPLAGVTWSAGPTYKNAFLLIENPIWRAIFFLTGAPGAVAFFRRNGAILERRLFHAYIWSASIMAAYCMLEEALCWVLEQRGIVHTGLTTDLSDVISTTIFIAFVWAPAIGAMIALRDKGYASTEHKGFPVRPASANEAQRKSPP